ASLHLECCNVEPWCSANLLKPAADVQVVAADGEAGDVRRSAEGFWMRIPRRRLAAAGIQAGERGPRLTAYRVEHATGEYRGAAYREGIDAWRPQNWVERNGVGIPVQRKSRPYVECRKSISRDAACRREASTNVQSATAQFECANRAVRSGVPR